MKRLIAALAAVVAAALSGPIRAAEQAPRAFVVDFSRDLGRTPPRVGFLGGLRDSIPDDVIRPLRPALWRMGHQFRGRIAGGLTAAIDRAEKLGARYKLVMSDLIKCDPANWSKYEDDIQKLAEEVGDRARRIIWEPVNEPDISYPSIQTYYEIYARAFRTLRGIDPQIGVCGPGFAFPSLVKYRAFLDYCRDLRVECNHLAWHHTGWDPDAPERMKWDLDKLPALIKNYPEQKIREIHCDEWGASPDKPGRLQPGRAIVWFHYLENIYQVDGACRANWGREDDYLGGLVDASARPHPVYHAYRLYADLRTDLDRVPVDGSDPEMACLAGKEAARKEILLGSIAKDVRPVVLVLKGIGASGDRLTARRIPNTSLAGVLAEPLIPVLGEADYQKSAESGAVTITLPRVEPNEVYYIRFAAR